MRSRGARWAVLVAVVVIVAAAGFGWYVSGWSPGSGPAPERILAPAATDPSANATAPSGPAFRDVANETGLNYTFHSNGEMVRGGVYVADVDNDRRPDVLATGGDRPVLFGNEGGSFERLRNFSITAKAALFFDYDNDGRQDLLMLSPGSEPTLFENRGGEFTARDVGFDTSLTYPVGATTADYDGDGCLDLFVFQYGDWDAHYPAGRDQRLSPGAADNGNPNLLFDGNCSSFTRVEDAGIEGNHWSLAASFADVTGDGRPDIHVGNDFDNDTLYVNRGDGAFDRVELGSSTDRNAMSSEVADVNGDGRLDVFVTNIYFPEEFGQTNIPFLERGEGNNLLINEGDGAFGDSAATYGVRKGGWGWAATIADFDNDGDRELFHATTALMLPRAVHEEVSERELTTARGYIARHPYLRWPVYAERVGDTFDRRNASRLGFDITDGRGVSRLDFDGDGDLDLVVSQQSGRLKLYENTVPSGNWLRVTVAGNGTVPATGARIHVTTADRRTVRTHARNARADFLSQESRVVHVGVGTAERITAVRIVWPDGTEQILRDLDVNQSIRVTPGGNVSQY